MKNVARILAVALFLVSMQAFAANLDGSYSFSSRVKDGKADMAGWNGTMSIAGDRMKRTYTSPDGKETKFYEAMMKQEGDVYAVKLVEAYKPEYVGTEYKNKITLNGNTLTMEGTDSRFKEVWTKK